jgi:tetratricopeptide (TPR) repeat protein
MFTNTQNSAIVAAGKAEKNFKSASEVFRKRLVDMSKVFKAADLAGKSGGNPAGKHRDEALTVLSKAILTKPELAAYNSEGVANPSVNGKRKKTAKGNAQNRVSECLARIVQGLKKIEAGDESAKGAKSNTPRDLNARIREEIGTLHKAVTNDKSAEAPVLSADHDEMLAAFKRVLDLVPEKRRKVDH